MVHTVLRSEQCGESHEGNVCAGSPESLKNKPNVDRFTFASLGHWDWTTSLSSAIVPTLIIQGELDPLPIESARKWAAAMPNARLLELKGIGPILPRATLALSDRGFGGAGPTRSRQALFRVSHEALRARRVPAVGCVALWSAGDLLTKRPERVLQASRNPTGRRPAFRVSWTAPSPGADCGGSACPCTCIPENDADLRQQLLLHALFHRIQPELGFMHGGRLQRASRYARGARLDAARMAGAPPGDRLERGDRAEAIADALAFRRERRLLFPGAADNERRDEIREGLASYTGIAAWANSPSDARRAAASALGGVDAQTSLVGNFEGASGPAYGVLLDDLLPGWRRQVRSTSDLGDMLASATDRPATTDVAVAAARYDAATLRTAEEARDRAQQVRVAELRRRFVDGPVLTMPGTGSGTSDTTGSVGIPGVGTVFFRNFTLTAQWGRLTADGGVLRAVGGATLSVPVTGPLEGTTLQGDGWSATLNSRLVVRPGAARPGSFVIVREN